MPANRKPAERRQGRATKDVGLVSPQAMEAPVPPAGLLKVTREQWAAFWSSESAGLVMPADLPALERLFSLYDERERCMRSARKGRLVPGSTGQPTLNPLYKQVNVLDSAISTLEDRFGLTPLARLKLGATFGDAHRSLAQLNAEADDDVDDPRLGIIAGHVEHDAGAEGSSVA